MRRMKLAGTCLLLIGCASDHSAPKPPSEAIQPRTCASSIALVGAVTTSPTSVALPLDGNGANICAHLDATQLSRAHFMAGTDQRPGTTSGFSATLQHADFSTILDGWDVSVGETSPQTFLNVEWSPPAGQTTDVIVWVRADSEPTTVTFGLDLFDPLE